MEKRVSEAVISPKPITTSLRIDEVLDGFLSTKRSENTKRAYARDILDLFAKLGVRSLDQLGKIMFHDLVKQIQDYLDDLTEYDEETNRPINPKTTNRKAYALSSFFKYLMHSYEYPKNPLDQYQAHKVDKRSSTSSLTRAEVLDVIGYMDKRHKISQTAYRDYLAICTLAVLALRRNELVGIKWSDLDLDKSSVNVFQKGGSYKLLPMPGNLLKRMLEYRSTYEPASDYIFSPVRNNTTKSLKKPLNTSYIYQLVQKVVFKVANGKRATPHSFRKTFIELALNNQEDFISIINATGHSTVEMIKYYDTRDTLKNNAVHGMSKLI
ncbi:tyrosine-type recombinase/integrase [Arenicella chitinivorans]|nr:site-specific integrase [Arenicella chitinivorans]